MLMRPSTYRIFACLAALDLAGLPRVAAADEWDSCVKLSDDLAVAGCSRAIGSHQYTGRSLARLYARRGGAYQELGDLGHSMADFDESMRIDPTYPSATTTAATIGTAGATSIAPFRTIIRRSNSLRKMVRPSPTAAAPGAPRATSTGRSRTITKRSGSIRKIPKPITTAAWRGRRNAICERL